MEKLDKDCGPRATGFGLGDSERKPLPTKRARGPVALIALVTGFGFALIGWTAYEMTRTPPKPVNIAGDALRYLRGRKGAPLSLPLEQIVGAKDAYFVETQAHNLLGRPAPDFTLRDAMGKPVRLGKLLERGPVVLVFYYGYWCDHCVAQLFALEEDLARFGELNATVVALSADTMEETREKFERYGAFSYPVLSDPHHAVATLYGVHRPAEEDKPAEDFHATFVIDREGMVRWVDMGDQPFIHNRTLLYELCRVEGRLPAKAKSEPGRDNSR